MVHVQDNKTVDMTLNVVNMAITTRGNAGEKTTSCKTQFLQVEPLSQMAYTNTMAYTTDSLRVEGNTDIVKQLTEV